MSEIINYVNMLPNTDNSLDMGSSEKRFSNIYVNNLHADNVTSNKFTFTIQSGSDWDNVSIPVYQVGENYPIQITKIKAVIIGSESSTLTFNFEDRGYGNLNSPGTQILSSDLVADLDGVIIEDLADPSQEFLDINDYLVFITSSSAESGTVYSVTCTVFYNQVY